MRADSTDVAIMRKTLALSIAMVKSLLKWFSATTISRLAGLYKIESSPVKLEQPLYVHLNFAWSIHVCLASAISSKDRAALAIRVTSEAFFSDQT